MKADLRYWPDTGNLDLIVTAETPTEIAALAMLITYEQFLKLIDILSKRLQDGGLGLADSVDSPLSKLRAEIQRKVGV